MTRTCFALLVVLACAAPVAAQAADVNNPTAIAFTASTDHAVLTNYEADIFKPDGTLQQTLSLGKPTPDATLTCTVAISAQSYPFGAGYTVRVRSVAPTPAGPVAGDWALASNKFNRVPGKPGTPVLK